MFINQDVFQKFFAGNTAGNAMTTTQQVPQQSINPCPCDCYDIDQKETWYITENCQSNDCIPFNMQEISVECDVPPDTQTKGKLPCEDVKTALRRNGYPSLQGFRFDGLSNAGGEYEPEPTDDFSSEDGNGANNQMKINTAGNSWLLMALALGAGIMMAKGQN